MVCGRVISSFSQLDRVRKVMLKTPGCVEFAAHLRMEEHDSNPLSGLLTDAAAGNERTSDAWSKLKPDEITALERVVDFVGSVERVVEVALSRLKLSIKEREKQPDRLSCDLGIIVALSSVPTTPIRAAFLDAGVSPDDLTPRNWRFIEIFVTVFNFLIEALDSTGGFTWIVQSLCSELLEAWVVATTLLPDRLGKSLKDDLVVITQRRILRKLVYRNVVSSAQSALRHIERNRREVAHSDTRQTEQISVATTLSVGKLAIDWEEGGHRQDYKINKGSWERAPSERPLNLANTAYLQYLVVRHAIVEIPTLRQIAAERYPSSPTRSS
ncbi:hypothetical protein NLJ89_g454 [Agrocybe chaxingu]|uniref:Uncharacterized protein n=1 Tax=Agrocybe chaxingu TaxID=84603 RepID=A0A9W8N227_9AGAR|nr:hypothetical protein NLJ89_g454 [Agrocybe chaxingu]